MPQHRKQVTYLSVRTMQLARLMPGASASSVRTIPAISARRKASSCYSRRRFGRSCRRRFGVGRAHPVQQLFRAIGRASGRGSGGHDHGAEGAGAKSSESSLRKPVWFPMRETSRSASTRWALIPSSSPVPTHSRAVCHSTHHQPADGRSGGERAHHPRRQHA